jgi:very-short-patch-repair endonuclease
MRQVEVATTAAELLWFNYAELLLVVGKRRGYRRAILAGLFFTDLAESIAESLLIARTVEAGFSAPFLQVSILRPGSGEFLGRVDGLWPTEEALHDLHFRDTAYGRRLFLEALGDNHTVIIEFDGRIKYDEDYQGRLDRERLRQNSITNLGYRFVRVTWDDLMHPERFRQILTAARLPRIRRRAA